MNSVGIAAADGPESTSTPTGTLLRDRAGALADAVAACEFSRNPTLRARYGATGRATPRRDAIDHLRVLAAALEASSPALFNDYIGWVKLVLQEHAVLSEDLDRHLRCMAEVVRQKLPPSVAVPAAAMIDGARSALPAMPAAIPSFIDPAGPMSQLTFDYVHALLGGYRQAAGRLVFDAAERGESVPRLYLQVFQPALREIGRLWALQKISVAQEHFCCAATQVVMSQLLARERDGGRRGPVVVIVCVSGDLHEVGARMVGDFFAMAGWNPYFCGANTPHAAVLQTLQERGAEVLAVSATMAYHLHAVKGLIEAVRADPGCASVRIMVGGHPFSVDPALWRTVGADGTASDAEAAVALADDWRARRAPPP